MQFIILVEVLCSQIRILPSSHGQCSYADHIWGFFAWIINKSKRLGVVLESSNKHCLCLKKYLPSLIRAVDIKKSFYRSKKLLSHDDSASPPPGLGTGSLADVPGRDGQPVHLDREVHDHRWRPNPQLHWELLRAVRQVPLRVHVHGSHVVRGRRGSEDWPHFSKLVRVMQRKRNRVSLVFNFFLIGTRIASARCLRRPAWQGSCAATQLPLAPSPPCSLRRPSRRLRPHTMSEDGTHSSRVIWLLPMHV